jgi:hypothetical protein
MNWYRQASTLALAGLIGLAGLTACGSANGAASETAVDVAEALGPEAGALAAMGFAPADMTPAELTATEPAPTATSTPGADRRGKRHTLRVFLRKNMLHGEAVVMTKDGTTKTIVVQRGTVTALTATTITVKSTDGFTLTWTLGDPLRVVEHRTTIQPSQVAVGAEVGIAGSKDGDKTVARLILIPNKKK